MENKFPVRNGSDVVAVKKTLNSLLSDGETCSIKKCNKPVVGRGWCRMHYNRWRRTGCPTKIRRVQKYEDGRTKHPLYGVWKGIKQRCLNPNHSEYNAYGGGGIKVSDKFLGSDGFANFLAELGERPGNGYEYQVDRIDNDGDYAPGNIRWATMKEQANNNQLANKVKKSAIKNGFTVEYTADIRTIDGTKKFKFSTVDEMVSFINELKEGVL